MFTTLYHYRLVAAHQGIGSLTRGYGMPTRGLESQTRGLELHSRDRRCQPGARNHPKCVCSHKPGA